jgi:hypothetical protein
MIQRSSPILALAAVLTTTACGDWRGPRAGEVVVDTLDSGAVRVRSSTEGVWGEGEAWRLLEDLRIGADDGGPAAFGDRVFVQADDAGHIYVADVAGSEVRVFDARGRHVRSFGGPGDEPGEFRRISGMDWGPDGRLRIMDGQLARLSVFDADGSFHGRHDRLAGFVTIPWRGRVDRQGNVYDLGMVPMNDHRRMAIVRFDAALVPRDTLPLPPHEAPTFDLTDPDRRRTTAVAVPFAPLQVWHVAADGTVWVGVTDRYRLHQLAFDGDTLRILERPARAGRVSAEERQRAVDELAWFADRGGEVEASSIPDRHPLFGALFTDDRDHLWVAAGAGAHAGPGTRFDIFDADGRYLGPVTTDRAVEAAPGQIVVRGGNLYAVVEDGRGAPYVVRYRILGA